MPAIQQASVAAAASRPGAPCGVTRGTSCAGRDSRVEESDAEGVRDTVHAGIMVALPGVISFVILLVLASKASVLVYFSGGLIFEWSADDGFNSVRWPSSRQKRCDTWS